MQNAAGTIRTKELRSDLSTPVVGGFDDLHGAYCGAGTGSRERQ